MDLGDGIIGSFRSEVWHRRSLLTEPCREGGTMAEKQRFHHEAKFQAAEVTATVEPKKQRIQQDKVTNHSAELPVPLITFLDHYLGGFLNMGPPVVTMD